MEADEEDGRRKVLPATEGMVGLVRPEGVAGSLEEEEEYRNGDFEEFLDENGHLSSSLSSDGFVSGSMMTQMGIFKRLFYRFRRFWISCRPDDWSGESDPQRVWSHFLNIVTLLLVAAIVLTLPTLLNIIAPRAPIAPGTSLDPGQDITVESGRKAAVAADNSFCSQFGLEFMTNSNGKAADAAVAAALCQGVLHPFSSGIGGSGLIVYLDGSSKKGLVYDGLSSVPKKVKTPFTSREDNASGAGVPGFLKALEAFHKEHGKLQWQQIVSKVAVLAEEWTVSGEFAAVLKENEELVMSRRGFKELFTRTVDRDPLLDAVRAKAGEPNPTEVVVVLTKGDKVKQPKLAKTLRSVADKGATFFYETLASEIENDLRARKGTMAADDLKSYRSKKRDPVVFYVDGYKIFTAPPPSAGIIVAKAINILEGFRLRRIGRNGMAYHFIIEATKLALADRDKLHDPDFDDAVGAKVKQMLDKDEAQRLRAGIDRTVPDMSSSFTGQDRSTEETKESGTQVTAIDSDGNTVSIAATLGSVFGSTVFSTSVGVLLNDDLLHVREKGKDLIPGMRPMSGMAPAVVVDFEKMQYALGSGGGFGATQATILTLMNAIEYGDDVGVAIAAPRLEYVPDTEVVHLEAMQADDCTPTTTFHRTNGAPFSYWDEVCRTLKSKGHKISGSSSIGNVQGLSTVKVRVTSDESVPSDMQFFAFSDPRTVDSAAAAA